MTGTARLPATTAYQTPDPTDGPPDTTSDTAAGRASRQAGVMADALAAEHAAIYAYGPIGVRLDGAEAGAARGAEAAHRARRDALVLALAARDVPAPVAEPSYQLPYPVVDADDARALAVLVEERVAALWRAVLPEVIGEDRGQALEALVDAAVRATRWRFAAGVEPATVTFPGSP